MKKKMNLLIVLMLLLLVMVPLVSFSETNREEQILELEKIKSDLEKIKLTTPGGNQLSDNIYDLEDQIDKSLLGKDLNASDFDYIKETYNTIKSIVEIYKERVLVEKNFEVDLSLLEKEVYDYYASLNLKSDSNLVGKFDEIQACFFETRYYSLIISEKDVKMLKTMFEEFKLKGDVILNKIIERKKRALNKNIEVMIPSFNVTINGTIIDNEKSKFPFLVYDNITYFPMTSNFSKTLGLENSWKEGIGLDIKKNPSINGDVIYQKDGSNKLNETYNASIVSYGVKVNKIDIDNSTEEYPIFNFRNITYFPLTWKFSVDEFDWENKFDEKNGLIINNSTDEKEIEDFIKRKKLEEKMKGVWLEDDFEYCVFSGDFGCIANIIYFDVDYLDDKSFSETLKIFNHVSDFKVEITGDKMIITGPLNGETGPKKSFLLKVDSSKYLVGSWETEEYLITFDKNSFKKISKKNNCIEEIDFTVDRSFLYYNDKEIAFYLDGEELIFCELISQETTVFKKVK